MSGILIQNTISKFSKTKNQTIKRPPKVPKIKNIYKEASNKKVLLNRPPQKWESRFRIQFENDSLNITILGQNKILNSHSNILPLNSAKMCLKLANEIIQKLRGPF